MTDFENHPAGTADLVKRLLANGLDECDEAATRIEQLEADAEMMFAKGMSHGQQVLKDTGRLVIVDSPEVVELREALIRANAATAAAYEVAAREVECGCGAGPCQDTANCSAEDAAAIRALATPDQTAALNKLIAEAEARVWAEAERIAKACQQQNYPRAGDSEITKAYRSGLSSAGQAIAAAIEINALAASKKGDA